jgi:RHS repeat-associated protein
MITPSCDENVCLAGFSPSRPRRSPGHPVRGRDRVGGHRHRSSNSRRGSHPRGVVSCRASVRYRCRSAARKRPPGLRFGVGYRCYLKLGARYYNPTTGRFTQPDPAGQGPNLYSYAGDDPTNNIDPTGLGFWNNVVIGLGVVAAITAIVATAGIAPELLGLVALVAGQSSLTLGVNCTYGWNPKNC